MTRTPTLTPPIGQGPVITAFGLTTADNHVIMPDTFADDGTPIYTRVFGAGFFIFIEAKAGSSSKQPGTNNFNSNTTDPSARPDVQLLANRDMGNGSSAICDKGPAPSFPIGGVPGVNPPNFAPTSQTIANILNDFGCRLDDNTVLPCTLNSREVSQFVSPDTTTQVCTQTVVGTELQMHQGDTLLTVQWRDKGGNIGSNPGRLIIRVQP